jgi:outer membrane protein
MNFIKKSSTILIVLMIFISSSNSEDQIVYLDLDNVVSNTKAGKLILSKLEKSKNSALLELEKKEKDLKKIEDEIKKQKNVISEDEYKKRLVEFRKEITKFREDKKKVINEFNQKKQIEFAEFFKKITPVIEEFVSEKKIDIVLDKKNIFIATKKKDITKEIINIIDSKIK